ncbi:MAG: type I 3-dehydroquinate dehydratase [Candidatus Micrarchaeota archaeon]|nr:type I 3-dehydroquinate dehydratase [Candidatus Micrarchaeota archaeon]MDE1850183.1 type I 3-dehydroquinate dehydratase [Candidatus Micrarchaeota archaeon]
MPGTRKICATIMPQGTHELRGILREAARQRPDYLELRLDRLPPQEISDSLAELGNAGAGNTVLTLRSKEEGGHYEGSDAERAKILGILAKQNAMFVDVEEPFARRNKIFVKKLREEGTRVLLSYHNFYTTPIPRVLNNLCSEMLEVGDIAKMVTTAKTALDNLKIFKLYEMANSDGRLLSFAMGELGQISRIMSITHYGAPFAYCSLGEPIAPGMLSVREMRRIVRSVP